MEKVHKDRPEIITYLQKDMEEIFQESCKEIQTEFDKYAGQIWTGLRNSVNECMGQTMKLQNAGEKGGLKYLVFSQMKYAVCFDRLEMRIDALDDGFYLDTREAAAHYHASFLQDRYVKDIEKLYKIAGENFIRLQNHEFIKIKQEYTDYYFSVLYYTVKELAGLIHETVSQSGVGMDDGFKILYGDYMDWAVVLHREEEQAYEVFPDRN